MPTPRINSFKIILPHSKYLLLHDTSYLRFENTCKQVGKEEYLCQKTNQETIIENSPCEVHMLQYSKEAETCQPFKVSINQTKVENDRWIVIVPNRKIARHVKVKMKISHSKAPTLLNYLANAQFK